jgi:hypothetical protein
MTHLPRFVCSQAQFIQAGADYVAVKPINVAQLRTFLQDRLANRNPSV